MNREKILGKIRAFLNKTTENGATEHEDLSGASQGEGVD
jgi:hypothetical protein